MARKQRQPESALGSGPYSCQQLMGDFVQAGERSLLPMSSNPQWHWGPFRVFPGVEHPRAQGLVGRGQVGEAGPTLTWLHVFSPEMEPVFHPGPQFW